MVMFCKSLFEKVKVQLLSCVRLFATPRTVAHQAPPFSTQGKSTGVGCHFLLQGIFPTQGSNPGLPHCRQMLYCWSHQESPKIERNESCSFMLDSLQPHVLYRFPSQNTGVGSLSLLQGIFPIQGTNPGFLQ